MFRSLGLPAPARLAAVAVLSACTALVGVSGPVTGPAAAHATPKVVRIMPLGDSITRGGGQELGQYIGYRGKLQAYLKAGATGFRYNFVGSMSDKGAPDRNHEGHGGWTIDNLAAHIDGWMQTYQPDVVLLHAGTNNITKGDSPEVAAAKLQSLIAQIRSHSATTKIFVAKVIKSRDPSRQPRTNAYEALIPGVVAAAGPDVYLVDQSSVSGTDIYDWTHPNDFGYTKMAYNWYRALNTVIGGDRWRLPDSPYWLHRALVCQYDFTVNKRVCAQRRVNG